MIACVFAKILLFEWLLYCVHGDRARYAQGLLSACKHQNIVFVKIFQSLYNESSISPEFNDAMKQYTTNATYTNDDIDYESLKQIKLDYDIEMSEDRVLNSGMIAVVFKGRLRSSGQAVIIKLRRNGIEEKLRKGCSEIIHLYSIARYLYPNNKIIQLLKPFAMNISDIIEQCDFSREINNMVLAKQQVARLEYIKIPDCYNTPPDRINTSFIVMEHLEGEMLGAAAIPDAQTYFEYIIEYDIYTFVNGLLYHSDQHTGNLIFMRRDGAPVLGIIDFGLVIHPTPQTSHLAVNILSVIMSFIDMDEEGRRLYCEQICLIEEFKYLFEPFLDTSTLSDGDIHALNDAIFAFLEKIATETNISQRMFVTFINTVCALIHRELVLNRDMYNLIMGMTMSRGVGGLLLKDKFNPTERKRIIHKLIRKIVKNR